MTDDIQSKMLLLWSQSSLIYLLLIIETFSTFAIFSPRKYSSTLWVLGGLWTTTLASCGQMKTQVIVYKEKLAALFG